MKILKLVAENVKKITVVEITPDGALVPITGPNASGKSSVLDAIYWALAGTKGVDAKPVREGAKSARIRLDLGEIVVTRKFTAAGGTSLVVEAADGSAEFKSPQSMLDKLLGSLTFDPLAFSRMEAKAQLDQLRTLVPVAIDIDALDFENRRDFEARTATNRLVKEYKAQIAGATPEGERVEGVSVNGIMAEQERAIEHNRAIDAEEQARAQGARDVAGLVEDLERVDAQIEALTQTRDQIASAIKMKQDLAAAAVPLAERVDLATFRARMDEAQRINALATKWAERDRLERTLATVEAEATELTARMDARTVARVTAIAEAKFPVDGLSFGDGEVTFNGHPFGQASSAEQLRVSVALAMAANPTLRVIRIKDGSLLDAANLATIAKMAEEKDYQVWIEIVDESGKLGVVMEDGHVAGAAPAAESTDA